jgi:hypothetical protein
LIANSYLVGACTGRSAGFSPLRMRCNTPGMASRTQSTVIFACPKCGIAYQATQQQDPDDQKYSFGSPLWEREKHAELRRRV